MLKEVRVLHLDPKAAGRKPQVLAGASESSKLTPSTRPHFLIEPLPMGPWGPFLFKPEYRTPKCLVMNTGNARKDGLRQTEVKILA